MGINNVLASPESVLAPGFWEIPITELITVEKPGRALPLMGLPWAKLK